MISVVICSIDAAKFRAASANNARLLAGEPHEIIGIHDARSLCEGYNRGAAMARGDLLLFSHDDVEFLAADFCAKVKRALATDDVVGVAGTSRLIHPRWTKAGPPWIFGQVAHAGAPGGKAFEIAVFGAPSRRVGGIHAVDGLWFGCRREAWDKVRFDEETFDGFHLYDLDFSFRAHLAGLRVAVRTDLHAIHASRGGYDARWEKYAERFLKKHRASLHPMAPRAFQVGGVEAQSRAEAVALMTPPHWADQEEA